MTTRVETFVCKITDEYGGNHPQAVAAILSYSVKSQKTGQAFSVDDAMKFDYEVEGISYIASFWNDETLKRAGKRSRHVRIDNEHGMPVNEFAVDLSHPDIIEIMNSGLEPDDKEAAIIKSDLMRKFI